MSDSEHKTDEQLGQAVTDNTSPPPSPRTSAFFDFGSVPFTADPQLQDALAELRRQRDEDKAERQSILTQMMDMQKLMMRHFNALEARPSAPQPAAAASAPLLPSVTPLPTAAAVPLGINPALLATPATVRFPQPAYSPAVHARALHHPVARGLFTNAVDSTQQPPRPYDDEEKGWEKWVQDAKKAVKIDPFKGGTQDERRNIRTWVTSLSMQLDLIAPPRRADKTVDRDRHQLEQARVATTFLQEGALTWAVGYQMQSQLANQAVRWDTMSFDLMAKYEGQDHGLLRQQELQNLTYKRGRCTDLPKYEGEFDRLALLVHGSNMQIPAVDSLLGQLFAEGIRRGDERLYESMLPVGSALPQSLQEWKGRAESAMVRSQALKIGSNTRPSTAQAAIHNTELSDDYKSAVSEQSSHSSPSPSFDMTELVRLLAAMQTQSFKKKPNSKKYQLTTEERSKLFAARKCFCCYKTGHTAAKCTQKATLPTRAPTADDLK
jgi:hypothetical protein